MRDGGGRRPPCHRAVTEMHALCRRWICVGQGGCHSGPDATINTLTRSGCPDQRFEEGPLYKEGSSRRRFLAATMEVLGISLQGNASASCGRTQHHHDGITMVFTQHHPRVKDKAKLSVILVLTISRPVASAVLVVIVVVFDAILICPLWLFPTIASIRPTNHETSSTLRTTRHF